MPKFQFYPPLAHESLVRIPPNTSDKFVQLDFFLTFEEDNDSSGSWEIWTDLPRIDSDGQVLSQPGEWHSAAFAPHDDKPKPLINGHTDRSATNGDIAPNVIHLPSANSVTPPAKTPLSPTTQVLSIVIPATAGHNYSYTYRRVPVDGDIQWLGGLGGNGFIKLELGSESGALELESTGEWLEQPKQTENLEWHGIGIEYDEKSALPPRISPLPTSSSVTPIVVLLQATSPVHHSPFSTLLAGNKALPTRPTTHHLGIVSDLFAPLTVAAASALPLTTSTIDTPTYGITTARKHSDAISSALARSKNDNRRRRLLNFTGQGQDVTALALTPSLGDPRTSYIIVYSPRADQPRTIDISLSDSLSWEGALAVVNAEGVCAVYLPPFSADLSPSGARNIQLRLGTAAIAEVLQLIEFVELRGPGGEEPIWLAAPDAASFEIGEEEIDVPKQQVSNTSESKTLAPPFELGDHGAAVTKFNNNDKKAQADERVESVDETEEDQLNTAGASDERTWTLLDAIGHLFLNIWHLILGILGGQPSSPETSNVNSDVTADDGSESSGEQREVIQTPADETTPLLGSETLSRATSLTAFSPLASPASATTAKLPQTSPSNNVTSVTEITADNTLSSEDYAPTANSVEIRSHALATFTHSPPFRFLLPPTGVQQDSLDKLRFAVKLKTERDWEHVVPLVKEADGTSTVPVEVEIGSANEAATSKEWEVQIERI